MANAVQAKFKEALLQNSAGSSLSGSGTTGTYAVLVDTGAYTYNAAHQFYSDFAAGVVATEVELTAKTFVNGLFDAADSVISNAAGVSAEAIAIFVKNAGANTTWRFAAWLDTGVGGLPVTPNTGNINITWNASGIFQL